MQLSHSVMTALLYGAEGPDPTPADPVVASERQPTHRLPADVWVRMALGEEGGPSWDYDFDPWPPCSFG
jgi:hypothetical protein